MSLIALMTDICDSVLASMTEACDACDCLDDCCDHNTVAIMLKIALKTVLSFLWGVYYR
jgi:hypothetical protein